ncbi:dTDP-4-dehydrorhamnose reductase [Alteromonadaceae bacterium Bs31]|nr:dTDP-4-dehydrorhamnose reductase [Alteromonadaceae bacterium Bs31]
MSYRILIRQADTDLASLFSGVMEDYPYVLLAPEPDRLDWADSQAVLAYFSEKNPSLVINFNRSYLSADQSDVLAMNSLASACLEHGTPMIALSSFFVFGSAYNVSGVKEVDVPAPEDERGRLLFAAEEAALRAPKSVVLRLPWLLDLVDDCLFDRLIPHLIEDSLAPVSDHHRFYGVSSGYVIRCLIAMINQIFCGAENWGVMHLRSTDLCSEAEFVDAIVRLLNSEAGFDVQLPQVISGRESQHLLAGSANLLGRRCTDDFGIQYPSWRHGFKSLIKRWLHDRKLVPDMRKLDR